jgi:hypothetical protein
MKRRKKRPLAPADGYMATDSEARERVSGWFHAATRNVCIMGAQAGDAETAYAIGTAAAKLQAWFGMDIMVGPLAGGRVVAIASAPKRYVSGPEFLAAVTLATGMDTPARFDAGQDLVVIAEDGATVFEDLLRWAGGEDAPPPLTEAQERRAQRLFEGAP